MAYLFHKKLITSSTNTPIKNTVKQVNIIGVIQKARHSQNLIFWVSNITFFLASTPASLFVTLFFNFPSSFSWVTHVLNGPILLSDHNTFSNKTVLFLEASVDLRIKKIAPVKVFGYFPVNYQWLSSFYVHLQLVALPVSFPKSCLELPFCKDLVSGTCR